MTYPKPATPLPWPKGHLAIRYSDLPYVNHVANAFPSLVAALELAEFSTHATSVVGIQIRHALAIARGEVTP